MSTKEQADIRKKLKILNHVKESCKCLKHVGILAFPERLSINGKGV